MNIIFKPECKTEIIKPTYDLPIIGEPISKTGASANNSNAYGVIVGIIGDGSSRKVRVMTKGYIDYDKVKENYMEYTGEAINALTGITLCSGGKLPTGGGSDPIVENAKQTGGFGYTEQGNQTVITWDGNTEGKQMVSISNEIKLYKIAELTPTTDEVIGGVIYTKSGDNGTFPSDITSDSIVQMSEYVYQIKGYGQSMVVVALEYSEINGFTFERGVYFNKIGSGTLSKYIKSITYGTPDTVHKIDKKYVPVISDTPSNDNTYTLTCTVTNGEPAYSWKPAT